MCAGFTSDSASVNKFVVMMMQRAVELTKWTADSGNGLWGFGEDDGRQTRNTEQSQKAVSVYL